MLNESIYQFLVSDEDIFEKLGNRIYTDFPITPIQPYLIYRVISEYDIETLTDQSSKLIATTIQFDVYSLERHTSRDIILLVQKAFKNLYGEIGDNEKTTISAVNKLNRYTGMERNNNTGEQYFIETLELRIWNYE